jgi:predicted deacylase
MYRMNRSWLLVVLLLIPIATLAQVTPFSFAGHTIQPGQQQSLEIPVVAGKDSTVIPVTVIHGAKAGPVLTITAGIHGYEYPPIMAAQQLPGLLHPADISGTVILVQVANVPAFLGRSIYYNPIDGKNLNRSFPGSPDGTLTDRMAWTLAEQVISRCNYFVDVHAGDGNEDLHPYVGYYNYHGHDTLSEQSRQMAYALGFDYIIPIPWSPVPGAPSMYGTREAMLRNIPTVAIECGRLGIVEPENIRQINNALTSLMRHLHMLPGKPLQSRKPVIVKERSYINSEYTGIFYSTLKSNDRVRKGMKLGYYTDLFGRHLGDVTSPMDGRVIYKIGTPPVNKGETLFCIGQVE